MKNKRNLLLCGALLCAAVIIGSVASIAGNQSFTASPAVRENFMFDTLLSVSVYDVLEEERSELIFEQVYTRSKEIEDEFTVFSENSIAHQINQKAAETDITINDDFDSVIRTALEVSELTGGAFDITIKPLSDLWNFQTSAPCVPSPALLRQAAAKVDYRSIQLSDHTLRFQNPNTQIEFGAIAKGYAVQQAAEQLKELGIKNAIVNYGGNVALMGEKVNGSLFSVGLQTPFAPAGEYFALLQLSDCALATSGAYERNFTIDGVLYHHILNPQTGYPVNSGLKSVTVICDDAAKADALSTAFFVMGLERALETAKRLPDTEVVLVDEQNLVYVTEALLNKITITNDAYQLKWEE